MDEFEGVEGEGFELKQEQDGVPVDSGDDTASMLAQLEQLQAIERGDVPEDAEEEEESRELSTAERRMAARVTASVIAGGTAEGLEFFLKPVKVDDTTRETFADRLAAVLEKHDGELPPWLARLIADWKEEFALARFMVFTGWEIRRQYKAEQGKTLQLTHAAQPVQQEKPRMRVVAGV